MIMSTYLPGPEVLPDCNLEFLFQSDRVRLGERNVLSVHVPLVVPSGPPDLSLLFRPEYRVASAFKQHDVISTYMLVHKL